MPPTPPSPCVQGPPHFHARSRDSLSLPVQVLQREMATRSPSSPEVSASAWSLGGNSHGIRIQCSWLETPPRQPSTQAELYITLGADTAPAWPVLPAGAVSRFCPISALCSHIQTPYHKAFLAKWFPLNLWSCSINRWSAQPARSSQTAASACTSQEWYT